jgi:hypothetical protein
MDLPVSRPPLVKLTFRSGGNTSISKASATVTSGMLQATCDGQAVQVVHHLRPGHSEDNCAITMLLISFFIEKEAQLFHEGGEGQKKTYHREAVCSVLKQ